MEVEEDVPAATGLTTYQAYRLPGKDLMVFGRNALISDQVWSADFGYPGEGAYREFHRGHEWSGLKYWRVTSRDTDLGAKEPYDPLRAAGQAREHARHFAMTLRSAGARATTMGFGQPLLVGCYDTELFGHWWWEGIAWLEEVIRELSHTRVRMILPGEITANPNALPPARLYESSWGTGGKHWGWFNEETSWMWDTIEKAVEQLESIEEPETGPERGAYRQAWRELLLMESSDWFFMVTNNLTRDYAVKRFFEHFAKLSRICDTLHDGQADPEFSAWLAQVMREDGIFTETL
jgi:1,4-alpha-glucan branching enzyme